MWVFFYLFFSNVQYSKKLIGHPTGRDKWRRAGQERHTRTENDHTPYSPTGGRKADLGPVQQTMG